MAKTVVKLFLGTGLAELIVPYPMHEAEKKLTQPVEGRIRINCVDENGVEAVANFKDEQVNGFITFPHSSIARTQSQPERRILQ